jgi:hypothetical protein
LTNAHGLFVLSNCYTLAGFIFPGGSSRINWAYVLISIINGKKRVMSTESLTSYRCYFQFYAIILIILKIQCNSVMRILSYEINECCKLRISLSVLYF